METLCLLLLSVVVYSKAFYFEKSNEFNILSNNLLQTLPELRKEYTVSFKLKPNSYSKGWKSVLHLTLGNDYGAFGDRSPGIWFHEDGSGKLSIFGAISNNNNYYVETVPLPLREWSHIKIYQRLSNGLYLYSVDLNGENIHSVENSKATVFKNVKVYAGDPWYSAQDGSIKDLRIFNGNAEQLIWNVSTPLEKGNYIALIPKLEKEYLVSFDVKYNLLVGGWHSVIHFTIGADVSNYGDRVPGVWFHESGKGGLLIAAPINGDRNRHFVTKLLAVNQWSQVEISQTLKDDIYVYTVRINGSLVFSENNKRAQTFDNVKVYASDPWYDSQDGSIRNLFIINGISSNVLLPPVTVLPKDYINHREEVSLAKGLLFGTLDVLRKEYTVSFNIKPNSYSIGWKSVLHLTAGKDYGAYSDRIPGVWFNNDGSGTLSIFVAVSGNADYYIETAPLPLGQWSLIKIVQSLVDGKYWLSVDLNGVNIHKVENSDPRDFKSVKVYAADLWYDAQDGSIKDLLIINGNAEDLVGNIGTRLEKGELVAVIPKLDKEYLVSFDVKPNSFVGGWHSVIHFTIGADVSNYGDRAPGVWFHESGKGGLLIAAPINGDRNRHFVTKPLAVNQWSQVEISQTLKDDIYVYTVRINGSLVFSENNKRAQTFDNVKVYASDPWYDSQDGSIKNLFIINGVSSNVSLPPVTVLPKDYINHREEVSLAKGLLFGTLDVLRKEYTVSFNIKPNSYSIGWKSVLHLTLGENLNVYGDRVPGVWFKNDGSGTLSIFVAVSGNANYYIETAPLPLGQWSLIKIVQSLVDGKYWLSVDLNGVNIHKVENSDPRDFKSVKVYAADLWYDAQDGSIKDLLIINGNAEDLVGSIDTPLVKGNIVAVIPKLDKEYLVSFDVKPNSFVGGWHSVIHFTIGADVSNYGDRAPGVWFHESGKGGLLIAAPINGDRNRHFVTKPLAVNQWSQVEISQTLKDDIYVYTVRINGSLVFSENNKRAQTFDNVKVYASDPWYNSQDGSIKNLFIINGVSSNVSLPPVTVLPKGKAPFRNAITLRRDFVDNGLELVLRRSNLVTTLALLKKQYSVSFEVKPTAYVTGWHSVIHLTIGQNFGTYGDRNPGIWFLKDGSGKLVISSGINGKHNHNFTINSPLPLNQWTKIEISQRLQQLVYIFEVKRNGALIYHVLNNDARDFQNVKVYASDPWYSAQPGSIKNLKITNEVYQ